MHADALNNKKVHGDAGVKIVIEKCVLKRTYILYYSKLLYNKIKHNNKYPCRCISKKKKKGACRCRCKNSKLKNAY